MKMLTRANEELSTELETLKKQATADKRILEEHDVAIKKMTTALQEMQFEREKNGLLQQKISQIAILRHNLETVCDLVAAY